MITKRFKKLQRQKKTVDIKWEIKYPMLFFLNIKN